MRLVAMALLVAFAGTVFATAPFNDTVGTDSVQLVAKKPVAWTAWAAGTVAIGDVVKASNGYYYFCALGGTASVEPTHTTGEVTSGTDSITWRQISPNKRQAVVITVQTTSANGGAVNLSFGTSAAVKDKGVRLVGEGATFIFDPADYYNGEIHAVSATGSNVVVGVQEF